MKKFLEAVALDLNEKMNGDFKNVSIICNNRRPSRYLQSHLAKAIDKAVWAPKFYTIQEFFTLLSKKKTASKTLQLFILYREIQDILHQEGLFNRWDIASFFSIGETILSDFGQIHRELVSADKIFRELREISEIDAQFSSLGENQIAFLKRFWGTFSQEKQQGKQEEFIKMWRRMPLLFEKFHESLEAIGFCTDGQIYAKVAQNLSQIPVSKNHRWVFVGFNALTAAEIIAFKYWQNQGIAWFYFDSDAHYIEDIRQEAGLFMRNNKNVYQLENQLDWNQNLLATPKKLKRYAAKGDTVQCTFLNDCLNEIFADKNTKVENTAIVLLNENLLLPALQHIPKYLPNSKNEIPLNISMGFSVKQNNIFNFLSNWIDLQKYYLNSGQKKGYQAPHLIVQSYLWNTYSGVQKEERDKILNEIIDNQYFHIPVSILKNDLFSNNDLYFEKVKNGAHAILQIKLMLEKATGILNQQEKIRKLEWETLQQLRRTVVEIESELSSLKELNLLNGETLKTETLLELWNQSMGKIQIAFDEFQMDALQIIGILETRSLDFENLIFVGANEGMLPKNHNNPTFIPDSIRRAHNLPVSENLDAISAYMFYRLIQRAKNINIIYNSHTDENNSGEVSRFIRQMEYELPYQIQDSNPHYRLSTPKVSEIIIQKDAKIQALLQESYSKKGLSPSSFTTYLNCSLQYFFLKIANIKEPKVLEEEIRANIIGNILHDTMHELYQPYHQRLMQKEDFEEIQSRTDRVIAASFEKEVFKNQDFKPKYTGNHLVAKEVVKQYVELILAHDKNIAPIFIMGLEEYFTLKYDFTQNGKKKQILLNGFIDRIDMLDKPTKKIRIVDYKTGKDQLDFKNVEEMFFPTTDMDGKPNKVYINKALIQTFIYTLMYESRNGFSQIEPNLYILREMQNPQTNFVDKSNKQSQLLNESDNAMFMNEFKSNFKALFSKKLGEMLDPQIPYQQTPFIENCTYCAYKNICGR